MLSRTGVVADVEANRFLQRSNKQCSIRIEQNAHIAILSIADILNVDYLHFLMNVNEMCWIFGRLLVFFSMTTIFDCTICKLEADDLHFWLMTCIVLVDDLHFWLMSCIVLVDDLHSFVWWLELLADDMKFLIEDLSYCIFLSITCILFFMLI